ncbi:response regulator transcription factor [Comamonas nitrativorans]|uniref:Response regulator transcription factor n=1 Tax=Comamonas nitrativorans TaxID=108437 RepID=A0ABV9GTA9_9BURK
MGTHTVKRVLIVEDHADIRKLVRMTLEFEGYEIHEATDAQQAQQAVRQWQPDVLVLDVMMPGAMNGLDVCRWVRSQPQLRRPWVILLSARGQSQDIEAGMQAGADAYLLKPFSPVKLIETVAIGTSLGPAS